MKTKIFILLVSLSAVAVTNAQKIVLNTNTCVGFWSREIGTFNYSSNKFTKDETSSLIFDDENQTITINGITYYDPLSEEEMFEKYGIMMRRTAGYLNVVDEKYRTFYSMEKNLYVLSADGQVAIEITIRVGDFDGLTSIIVRKHPYTFTDYVYMHYDKSMGAFFFREDDDGNYMLTTEKYPIYIEENHAREYIIDRYLN